MYMPEGEIQDTEREKTDNVVSRSPSLAVRAKDITRRVPRLPRFSRLKAGGVAAIVLMSSVAGFAGGWLGANSQSDSNSFDNSSSETQRQIISSESELINTIVEEVGPSVVSVNVTSQSSDYDSFFGFYGGSTTQESAGTGFIISTDGVIVTNRHVVPQGTATVSVTLSDGTELDNVEVIGRTNESDSLDIAFLQIKDKQGKELKPAKISDSSKVKVGDKVVAIGNALGQFQNTVTSGIISGYGRSVEAGDGSGSSETLQNLFQTDTAINQGNSGGPLVNTNGEVIGINTAVAGDAENIGFSIPINDVSGLITSVLETGKLERPYLGVRYVSLTDDYAYQYNLSVKRGAYVVPSSGGQNSIVSGSPAEKAGLQEKDTITKVNDAAIDEKNSLTSVLGRFTVGEEVTLTVVRDGKEQVITVKLEAAPTE